jgi:hypothetical protein
MKIYFTTIRTLRTINIYQTVPKDKTATDDKEKNDLIERRSAKQHEYSELLGVWTFSLSGILGNRKHDVSETDPVSETSCFLFPRIPYDKTSPKTQQF